jgi:hypothetical protein
MKLVVGAAQPAHLKGLGIVVVVRINLLSSARFARLSLKLP